MKIVTPGWDMHHWDPCFDAQRSDPTAPRREALGSSEFAERLGATMDGILADRRARLVARLAIVRERKHRRAESLQQELGL